MDDPAHQELLDKVIQPTWYKSPTEYRAFAEKYFVEIKPTSFSKYRIQFIGKGGKVLHESIETKAEYVFKGHEGYVRARVLESNGRIAWVQPVIVRVPGAGVPR